MIWDDGLGAVRRRLVNKKKPLKSSKKVVQRVPSQSKLPLDAGEVSMMEAAIRYKESLAAERRKYQ